MNNKKYNNKKFNNRNHSVSVEDSYTPFQKSVWQACSKIPKGKVSTYKLIAESLGNKAYRAVGHALNKNPYSPKVPCHRVVNSDGRIGGFAHGVKSKIKLLQKEGIKVSGSDSCFNCSGTALSGRSSEFKVLDFKKKLFK